MEEYLSRYGWHFSKPMYEWAVSIMRDRNGGRVTPLKKDDVEKTVSQQGVDMSRSGYDVVYMYHWLKTKCHQSSLADEQRVALCVKDFVNDKDGYEEMPFTHFYADCVARGIPIIWEDLL